MDSIERTAQGSPSGQMSKHKYQNGFSSQLYSHSPRSHKLTSATYDDDSGITSASLGSTRRDSSGRRRGVAVPTTATHATARPKARPKSAATYESATRDGTTRLVDLQHSLDSSECRRRLMTQKLRDAKDTIERQADRLNKTENVAKDQTLFVDELVLKEKDYKRKIGYLKRDNHEYQSLTLDSLRTKGDLHQKVNSLDTELKSVQSSCDLLQRDAIRKQANLDKSTASLNALDEQNSHLIKAKDSMSKQMSALKESLEITRCKNSWLEGLMNETKTDTESLRQENRSLTAEVKTLIRQQSESSHAGHRLRETNSQLEASNQAMTQDKQKLAKQIDSLQESLADMRATLESVAADKERYFQQTLELHRCTQATAYERDNLERATAYERDNLERVKLSLSDQLKDVNAELTKEKSVRATTRGDVRKVEEELATCKKVVDVLSAELAGAKSRLQMALEQASAVDGAKLALAQQQRAGDQERALLQAELDQLRQGRHELTLGHSTETDSLYKEMMKVKDELRLVKKERNQIETKMNESAQKLRETEEAVKQSSRAHRGELDTLRAANQRLSSAADRKGLEFGAMGHRLHDLEVKLDQKSLESSHQQQADILSEVREKYERLRNENRRFVQERAENQQMIQLLELQKSILTKTSEGALNCEQSAIQLQCQVEQLKTENGLLKDKLEELQQNQTRLSQENLRCDEMEAQMSEMRRQAEHTASLNSMLMEQLNRIEQDNASLRSSRSNSIPRPELDRVENEKVTLIMNCSRLEAEKSQLAEQLVHEQATRRRLEAASNEDDYIDSDSCWEKRTSRSPRVRGLGRETGREEEEREEARRAADSLKEELVLVQQRAATCAAEAESERKMLKKQMDLLQLALEDAQLSEQQQRQTIETLSQKSLEDTSDGLTQMKTELHQLMEAIRAKDTTIAQLETKLETATSERDTCVPGDDPLNSSLATARKQKREFRRQVAALTAERDDATRDADAARSQLGKLQRRLAEDEDIAGRRHQRELRAKDRQIESLEEQLQRNTHTEIKKLKRDAGKVELLQGENRRLHNQLSGGATVKASGDSDDDDDGDDDDDDDDDDDKPTEPSWLLKYTVAPTTDEEGNQINGEAGGEAHLGAASTVVDADCAVATADDDADDVTTTRPNGAEPKSENGGNGAADSIRRTGDERVRSEREPRHSVQDSRHAELDSPPMATRIPRHRHSERRGSPDSSPPSPLSFRRHPSPSPSRRVPSPSPSSRALLRSTARLLRDSDKLLASRSGGPLYPTSARPYSSSQYRPSREFTGVSRSASVKYDDST